MPSREKRDRDNLISSGFGVNIGRSSPGVIEGYYAIDDGISCEGGGSGIGGHTHWSHKRHKTFGLALVLLAMAGAASFFRSGNDEMLSNGAASRGNVVEAPEVTNANDNLIIPVIIDGYIQKSITDLNLNDGYKINVPDRGNVFRGKVFEDNGYAIRPNGKEFTLTEVIETSEDLTEMMDVRGSLSVSYGVLSGKLDGGYIENSISSKKKAIIKYQSRRVAYVLVTTEHELNEAVKNLLISGNTDDIYDEYGTLFVSEVHYGGQLDIKYEVTSESDIDMELIRGGIEGKIGVGPIKGALVGKLNVTDGNTKAEYRMKIVTRTLGMSGLPPPGPGANFDEINTYIDKFNERYQIMIANVSDQISDGGFTRDKNPIISKMTAVALGLDNISKYLPNTKGIEAAHMRAQMNKLSVSFQQALMLQARLDFEETQLELSMSIKEVHEYLKPWQEKKKEEAVIIAKKIQDCLDYREKTVSELYKNDLKVPEKLSPEDVTSIDGLLGKGYLRSAALTGTDTIENAFYTGYVLYNNGVGKPFYYGAVTCNRNDQYIAGPDKLEHINDIDPKVCLNSPPTTHAPTQSPTVTVVRYMDKVYLQNRDVRARWLTGRREKGNIGVLTKNLLASEYEEDHRHTYEWYFYSVARHSYRGCVRYGDKIHLANGVSRQPPYKQYWLFGGRGSNADQVYTYEKGTHSRYQSEQWTVRSNPGSGSLNQPPNEDPKNQECVQDTSSIYLLCNSEHSKWLTGNRWGSGSVDTKDLTKEQDRINSYKWIIRVDQQGDGKL